MATVDEHHDGRDARATPTAMKPHEASNQLAGSGTGISTTLKIWLDAADRVLGLNRVCGALATIPPKLNYYRLEAGRFENFVSYGLKSFAHEERREHRAIRTLDFKQT